MVSIPGPCVVRLPLPLIALLKVPLTAWLKVTLALLARLIAVGRFAVLPTRELPLTTVSHLKVLLPVRAVVRPPVT